MRKVLTITTKTTVPVIATYKAIVDVDESVNIQDVVNVIVEGPYPRNITVQNAGIEELSIEGQDDGDDLRDQAIEHITSSDSKSLILGYEVMDLLPRNITPLDDVEKYALRIMKRNDSGAWEFLIVVLIKMPYTVSGILDHYAKLYGVEREKLRGYITQIVDLSEIHQ